MSSFTVTDRAHADCARCAQCVTDAETYARVTGSVGATYNVDTLSADLTVTEHHGATVARAVTSQGAPGVPPWRSASNAPEKHVVTTSDGWTCDVCGKDVNGSGQDGESVRHI